MRIIFLGLSIFTLTVISAQDNLTEVAQPIVEEGKKLYQSEMASWYGTDIFLANYKERANVGGYFSYSDNGIAKCIFFSKGQNPRVIGAISFDSTYNTKTANIDLLERAFTRAEDEIYTIRKNALDIIQGDTLFKTYTNSSLNLIPLITGNERKVYVLTGPKESGVVVFGNDYLLTFDHNSNLLSMKPLHNNIIWIKSADKDESGNVIEGSMHTHLPETGEFITATDICTLMLYEKFTKWKQHNVVSKNYLSIWNCLTDQLVVLPMNVIDKINKDQEKRNKKKK